MPNRLLLSPRFHFGVFKKCEPFLLTIIKQYFLVFSINFFFFRTAHPCPAGCALVYLLLYQCWFYLTFAVYLKSCIDLYVLFSSYCPMSSGFSTPCPAGYYGTNSLQNSSSCDGLCSAGTHCWNISDGYIKCQVIVLCFNGVLQAIIVQQDPRISMW